MSECHNVTPAEETILRAWHDKTRGLAWDDVTRMVADENRDYDESCNIERARPETVEEWSLPEPEADEDPGLFGGFDGEDRP